MKLVYIHGLGSDGEDPISEALRQKFGSLEAIEYYKLSEQPGWMEEAFNLVYNKVPNEPHVLVGHSLGGLFALYAVNEYTKALILLAPAISVNTGIRIFLFTETMKDRYVTVPGRHPVRMNKDDVGTFFRLMKDPPVPSGIPTLFLLAEEDSLVNNKGVHKYFRSVNTPRSWFLILAGASHNFSERENEVAEIIDAFLKLYLPYNK